MRRLGRRKAQQWLAPLRQALRNIRTTGEVFEAEGHALMEMPDAFVRIDHCIEGFVRMIARVLPDAGISEICNVRNKIGTSQDMTIAEIDAALAEINVIEPMVGRLSCDAIKAAVKTEVIAIELDIAKEKK